MDVDGLQSVVLDSGSKYMKVGFAAESSPRAVYPNAVGRFERASLLDSLPELYFGADAVKNRGLTSVAWPVTEGQITDWDVMEKLWHYAFYTALMVPPEQTKILHAVHPLVPRADRQRMAEIFFETFAIPAINLVKAPVLVLHASGRTTGVVYENGHSSAYVVPIYEGFPLNEAIMTHPVTGEFLTNHLQKLMRDVGYIFTTPLETDLIDSFKAKHCYVASDYEREIMKALRSSDNHKEFALPDGQTIIMRKERFECPEVLFQPMMAGLDCLNIPNIICSAISKTDIDYRPQLFGNVVASGGSTMFPGFVDRLMAETSTKSKLKYKVKTIIENLPSRSNVVWTGGSILASLDCLKGFWMTSQEYDEFGSDRVNYKFF